MVASWFVYDGFQAVRHPQEHVELARSPINAVLERADKPAVSDAKLKRVVQAHGVATVLLGFSLALSKSPRTAGVLLALSTAPSAVLRAPVAKAEVSRSERLGPFVAKLGAVGAALLIAGDTAGKPSMSWRVSQARAERAQRRVADEQS